MDRNAYRDENDTAQPDAYQADAYQADAYQADAYWRRRVITLCAGLALLGSWNRTISLPGCVTVASSARPGTYEVQARDASVASPVRTFKLGH
jgi:hypothetical protein